MKHVRKSILLWYTPHEMYALVTAIDEYPQFLPWCEKARVVERHEDGVTAKLTLAYMGVRQAFTTRNTETRDRAVQLRLVDGPFSQLQGRWLFHPVGAKPGQDKGCKVEFDLRYAFNNGPLDSVISPVFNKIADTLVDSFVRRAEDVYGAR